MENERKHLPVAREEDVEYSEELADQADREALERSEAANRRAAEEQGE
ncbi:YfhD family protein [Cohnella cellulosilytica]|uniref:YfhD family protein n=1 Tax=Cohnella cellulosilytica TaxID=986710 RepID=A0ABW2FB87_9BACL